MQTKAVRVHEAGGPEILKFDTIELQPPVSGEVLIRHTAVGVNLIDIYHRSATEGQYVVPRPSTLGVEAAGVIEAVGPDVEGLSVGDRVGYFNFPGAYAERRIIPAWRLVTIPDSVDDKLVAASLLKGATAYYLLHRVWQMRQKATIVVHAAAGGVGQILCRWANASGITVIGTVSSAAKMDIAAKAGCKHVLNYRNANFPEDVRKLTDGKGVDVVYDSIGRDTFEQSLDCLRPLGLMVSFGQASGPIAPFDISLLAKKGSIFLAKPTLATFTKTRQDILDIAEGVFAAIRSGAITVEIGLTAPLERVAEIHTRIENRETTGSTILLP